MRKQTIVSGFFPYAGKNSGKNVNPSKAVLEIAQA
jgi:hypothetical protein